MSLASKIHLRGGEEIKQIIRRYPITYFWQYMLGIVVLFITSFFMFWLFAQYLWGTTVYILGMLAGLYIIFRTWFFAHNNIMVITNERVVDINRRAYFDEIMSSAGYSDLKDIFVHKKGIAGSIFNYGSITIETKSEQVILEVDRIHKPQKWQSLILELRDAYKRNKHLSGKREIYDSFLKIVPQLSEEELCEVYDSVAAKLSTISKDQEIISV